ncbi:hypothetical protein [Corynebacterium lubricantis]|uniref:hypothetical protein n=1 Tax=Corynebacterium lubricantis TaxID=541095 RepID=UPI0012EADE2B|nr:hypothetical protein [Corynebacterium lubricantis]
MAMKKLPRDRQKCGTMSGYRQHVRHGERACEACNDANREYMREYRERKASGEKTRVSRGERAKADEARGARVEAKQEEYKGDSAYPAYLRSRGKRLWDELTSQFELTPQLRELVTEACRLADRLERMAAALSANSTLWFELGEPEESKDGDVQVQVVVNNMLSEARQTQAALATLLNKIGVIEKATARSGGESVMDQLARKREERLEAARKQAGEA